MQQDMANYNKRWQEAECVEQNGPVRVSELMYTAFSMYLYLCHTFHTVKLKVLVFLNSPCPPLCVCVFVLRSPSSTHQTDVLAYRNNSFQHQLWHVNLSLLQYFPERMFPFMSVYSLPGCLTVPKQLLLIFFTSQNYELFYIISIDLLRCIQQIHYRLLSFSLGR